MAIPAIVTAGDRGAAKAIYGQSKVYLEIAGRAMVAHVVAALQTVRGFFFSAECLFADIR